MKRIMALALVGLFVVALPASALTRALPNVRLAPDAAPARGREIPGLAVNSADPNHIVAVSEEFLTGNCDYHVTFDGGTTWETGHLRAPAGFPSPPCPVFDFGGYAHSNGSVVFGSGQNVYTTFSSTRGDEGESILVARSSDGGRTFSPAVVAIAGAPVDRPVINIRPRLTVAPREAGDRVYVVAIGCDAAAVPGGGACDRTAFAVSKDGGRTFTSSRSVALPTEGITSAHSAPAVGPDGTLYIALRRGTSLTPGQNSMFLATSRDDGASWTYSEIGAVNAAADLKLLAGRDGTLYLAYWAANFAADTDIAFQRRAPGSTAWSPPLRVNDDTRGNGIVQRLPWLSMSPDGRLDLFWHDRRHPYLGQRMEDYFYASSSDGGLSWSRNRRITDRSINLDVGLDRRVAGGFYWPALVPLGEDQVMAGWADSREGSFDDDNSDIYVARVDLAAGATPPLWPVEAGPGASGLAVATSRLAYPAGRETQGTAPATRVVVVNEADVPAALAGGVLARSSFGPVLVGTASGLGAEVKDEVARLRAVGAVMLGDEASLGPAVVEDLKAAGVPSSGITRMFGTDIAGTARQVAHSLDSRTGDDKTAGRPAFAAAVIANPATPDGANAAALAAGLRLPYLFVDQDSVPQATREALSALAVKTTLVAGSPAQVSDSVLGQLPGPKRLADAGAVVAESLERGLPANVVYVADQPLELALLGPAVARAGGLLLGGAGDPGGRVAALGLVDAVDRILVLRGTALASPTAQGPGTGGGGGDRLPATGGTVPPLLAAAALAATFFARRRARYHQGVT